MSNRRAVPPLHHTLWGVARAAVLPGVFLGGVWIVGAIGLHHLHFAGAPDGWNDAFFWAAMMLTGMGPPAVPEVGEDAVKWFLSIYALASNFLFLGAVGFALQPVFSRVLHVFHLDHA